MLLKARQLMKEYARKAKKDTIMIDGSNLNLNKLSILGTGQTKVELSEKAIKSLQQARELVEGYLARNETTYGINTGFGKLSNVVIPREQVRDLQTNLIRSHATGIGKYLSLNASRRVHAIRINTLAKGFSGISMPTMDNLINLFNVGVVPAIPEIGTVGASGDLAPLAHIALGLIGEGELWDPQSQQFANAIEVLRKNQLKVSELQAKDGLSLINGTAFICGVGSIALENSINIIKSISPISALTILALKGKPQAFDNRIHEARNSFGQIAIGEMMASLLPLGFTVENNVDIQDPYSLRCIPQVHGPVLESILYAQHILENEMNIASDNPLVFPDREPHIVSGGNFHGEYPAKALDTLALYVHEIGSMSYVRMKRLLNPAKSLGLPAFLTGSSGLCSGMMTWENVSASLVSENRVLVHPASADSAETCADKEDHVSMGGFAARKAVQLTDNIIHILAIELLAAVQALQFRFRNEPGFYIHHPGMKKIYEHVVKISPILESDRYTVPEYNAIHQYITSGQMWDTLLDEMNSYVSTTKKKTVDGLYLTSPPKESNGTLKYTKTREYQTQLGEKTDLFLSYDTINESTLSQQIKDKSKHLSDQSSAVISILDASQDDLGARANFGRGNPISSKETAYDQFLVKFSNFQVNKANQKILDQFLLLGSIDIQDLLATCQGKLANVQEERKVMIESLRELNNRSRKILHQVFQNKSLCFYMNGDHNNMGYIISAFYESQKVKPIVIYLDFHSDARKAEDGPHSGSWMTEVFEKEHCEKAYAIGINLISNSQIAIDNMDKYGVTYLPYTWDAIQRMTTTRPLLEISKEIVQEVKSKYGDQHPVILSICADTVQGLPCSAQNEVIGYPPEDVYPLVAEITKNLNVQCYNVSELKPSLDYTKNLASGEFLATSLYLYASTINIKNQK